MKQNNPTTPTYGWKLLHARMKWAITSSAASTMRLTLPRSAPSQLSSMKLRVSRKENIRLISQNRFPRQRRHLHLAIPHSGGSPHERAYLHPPSPDRPSASPNGQCT